MTDRSLSRALASEVNYQRLFEAAPDAVLVVGADGNYIDCNTAAEVLTGYTKDELRRMCVGDLTTAQEREISLARFELLRREGRTRRDRTIRRKDGRLVSVEAHAIALDDGTFMTTLRDVTDRLAAEQRLARSRDEYSTLVETCHAAVVAANPTGRITSWNTAAAELFGYSMDEAIGMAITRLAPPRLRRRHRDAFRRRILNENGGRTGRIIRTLGRRKDGQEIPVEVSVAVGRRGDDRMFIAVIRDISEYQQVVEKLNDALQLLQFHIDRMPLGYVVWDRDFRVVEWNPAAERMFGYTRKQARHRHAYDLIVPPDAKPAVNEVWSELLKGDTSSHSVNPNIRKDRTRLTCEWFNTALSDSRGSVRGVASMVVDISERDAVEAKIRDAQKLESLGVLAGGVAHDFNSALMVILGNTALLSSLQGLPQRASEHLGLIEEAGRRAQGLIKHLLAYARTGRHHPNLADLNDIICDCLEFLRSTIGKKHKVALQRANGLPSVRVDHSQIEQVLMNLCLNAKHAMPDGGTIRVRTLSVRLTATQVLKCVPYDAKPGQYVAIRVADTGCGMDEAVQRRMFDPFFTTKAEGHGLGMAAVLGILRQHRGAAMVKSTPGKGTSVSVCFPVDETCMRDERKDQASEEKSAEVARPTPRSARLSVSVARNHGGPTTKGRIANRRASNNPAR